MPSKLNVLVYNGSGVSQSSRDHAVRNLRSFLGHSYDVQLVSPKSLKQDPWTDTCALLVFPGGRDLPYVHDLEGQANDRIKSWVQNGGQYLGFCAGAYYASKRIEFEVGTPLEVTGERPLAFFPGLCKGTTFSGFAYETEAGARECVVRLERGAWRNHWDNSPDQVAVWYNGGGSFLPDHESTSDNGGYEVLARYEEAEGKPVAGVRCRVGEGQAILWAVHPEHPTFSETSPRAESLLHQDYATKETVRQNLLRATLRMFDLDVAEVPSPPPQLTPLFLCSSDPGLLTTATAFLAHTAGEVKEDDNTIEIKDRHDTFEMHPPDMASQLLSDAKNAPGEVEVDKLHAAVKHIVTCVDELPLETLVPLFSPRQHFDTLRTSMLGRILLYGETVTSTQTMLDKNDRFLSGLPSGLVCVASHQVAGRGRGGNSWVSPAGCLQFSLVVRLPVAEARKIVFVQYLFGLAVVEAIRTVPGYEGVPVRLKWPNDIYAEVDEGTTSTGSSTNPMDRFKKIGGILVNSSFANDTFTLVVGCGINTSNPRPTTSVNEIVTRYNKTHGTSLQLFSQEALLALILNQFERMWTVFRSQSFEPFIDQYLTRWIHSEQRVTIESTGQVVRIIGITPEHGLLRTVPVDVDSSGRELFSGGSTAGRNFVDLQPDGNGFDMLKSLLVSR